MISYIIVKLADLYTLLIIVYVLMSWFPIPREGVLADIHAVLAKVCEPYLSIFRKLVPPIGGVVDITPIIAIVVLELVVKLIFTVLL